MTQTFLPKLQHLPANLTRYTSKKMYKYRYFFPSPGRQDWSIAEEGGFCKRSLGGWFYEPVSAAPHMEDVLLGRYL